MGTETKLKITSLSSGTDFATGSREVVMPILKHLKIVSGCFSLRES